MPLRVQFPQPLAALVGAASVDLSATTVGDAVAALAARHPLVGARLQSATHEPLPFVAFYLNGIDIRERAGFATPVGEGDELVIVSAVAGG
jgi:molybdopterin converting factor small subunit